MVTSVIDVLGIRYTVVWETLADDPSFQTCDGYCDPSTKKVHVRLYNEDASVLNVDGPIYEHRAMLQNKVLRHEIVHAFMYESGLWRNSGVHDSAWSMNEEMIDWFAIQGPKIYRAWEEAGAV